MLQWFGTWKLRSLWLDGAFSSLSKKYKLHSPVDHHIHSHFASSVWKSERQSGNRGKWGIHHQQSMFPRRKHRRRRREVYFTFKSVLIFQIFISFYILVTVIVTTMGDKISDKNIAENFAEVSLKTFSDFQGPSNRQELQ